MVIRPRASAWRLQKSAFLNIHLANLNRFHITRSKTSPTGESICTQHHTAKSKYAIPASITCSMRIYMHIYAVSSKRLAASIAASCAKSSIAIFLGHRYLHTFFTYSIRLYRYFSTLWNDPRTELDIIMNFYSRIRSGFVFIRC